MTSSEYSMSAFHVFFLNSALTIRKHGNLIFLSIHMSPFDPICLDFPVSLPVSTGCTVN